MRICVTGGRRYGKYGDEKMLVWSILDGYLAPDLELGHGGADGVDRTAHLWLMHHRQQKTYGAVKIPIPKVYEAEWKKYGNRAGHERNELMLRKHDPEILVAFPGGPGTRDCTVQAYNLGITIHEYDRQGVGKVIKKAANTLFDFDLFAAVDLEDTEGIQGGDLSMPNAIIGYALGPPDDRGMVNIALHTGSPARSLPTVPPGGSYARKGVGWHAGPTNVVAGTPMGLSRTGAVIPLIENEED